MRDNYLLRFNELSGKVEYANLPAGVLVRLASFDGGSLAADGYVARK